MLVLYIYAAGVISSGKGFNLKQNALLQVECNTTGGMHAKTDCSTAGDALKKAVYSKISKKIPGLD